MEDDDTVGEIRLFAGGFAPEGWLLCNGAQLKVAGNEALFSLLGVTWGGGGDSFNLPDLRDHVPIGQGAGPTLTLRKIGERGGENEVVAETPVHRHTFSASTQAADLMSPQGAMLAVVTAAGGVDGLYLKVQGTDAEAAAECIGNNPGGQAHSNCMPSLALNYIICNRGVYPDRE